MATPESQGGIDYPDGGFTGGVGLYSLIGDLAELAARLESPVTFNREGCVMLIETFQYGLGGWTENTGGTGAEIIVSAANWRSRGYAAKLTGGSDGTKYAQIVKYFEYPYATRHALEFAVYPVSDVAYIEWQFIYHDGTQYYQYAMRWYDADETIYVFDENLDEQAVVTSIDLMHANYRFSVIKMAIDLLNGTFDRIIVNNQETDVSDWTAPVGGGAGMGYAYVFLSVVSTDGNNGVAYFDNVIVTRNEPARRE